MPAAYSYRVRVLAALDAFYNPQHPSPVSSRSINSKYESDCNASRLFLPSTWRKRVKITLDKLVSDGFLAENSSNYTLAPRLHTMIADEKVRLNVDHGNHEWRIFAGVAKKMEISMAANNGNAAAPSTPAGRTRNRISLSAVEIRHAVAGPAPAPSLPGTRTRKARYSDPGPFVSQAGPSSVAASNRNRGSIGNSIKVSGVITPRLVPVVSPHRRRTIVPARSHRRHTLAVAPTRQKISSPSPEPISQEIQFFPLRQALSARTRRALRRNALSEEMNSIDAEQRVGQKKNRAELARLRNELAESSERLRELERELAAARYAPSEEPDLLPPINEEQADDEDYDAGYVPADSPGIQDFSSPLRESLASDEPQVGNIGPDHTQASHRDQKIRDLEIMIEALRHDIAQRAEEERLRAQEDEIFHDAEEQILHEENYALVGKIEELTAAKSKVVSFDEDVQEIGPEESDNDKPIRSLGGFEVDPVDIDRRVAFRPPGIGSSLRVSNKMPQISNRMDEIDAHSDKLTDLEIRNIRLQQIIDAQSNKIREMEEDLEETQMSVSERDKALDKVKRENEKLRRMETEFEKKVIELEEMEGERLENVGHRVAQTDEVLDQEKIEMEEKMDSLTEQVVELQGMIEVVIGEKKEVEARIAIASSQVVSLQAAVEAGQVAKLEADSQIHALMVQIANIEDAISQESREAQQEINTANIRIEQLQKVAEAGEAAKIKAEKEILAVTNRAKELEAATFEERSGIEARIVELESAFESSQIANIEAETQVTILKDQVKNHEALALERNRVAQAQIADLQSVVESGEVAKVEADTQILNLMNQVKDLEATIAEEKRKADLMIITTNSQMEDLRATVEAGEVANAKVENQILGLKSQVRVLEGDLSALVEEKGEAQGKVNELSQKVNELEIDIGELREENAEIKQRVINLVQKSNGFEESAGILRQDKGSLEKNVESLEEKVEELEDAAEILRKAKISLETDSINLNAQLVSQQKATELAESTRTKFERNIVELRSRIEVFEQAAIVSSNEKKAFELGAISLRAQVSSLESTQKLTGDKNRDLQRKIDEFHTQIGSLEQELRTADQEKDQLEFVIAKLRAQIEALERSEKVVSQQKETLEQALAGLHVRLGEVGEELVTSCAASNLFRQDIENHKSEIESLKRLLELSNLEKKNLHHDIQELENKIILLEGTNKQNRDLRNDIEFLRAEINTLKQATEIADEGKSIIQQKIQPYIQGEQSLDMAVDEVLTELVIAKNRADESERIKTELSNKIKVLAQGDDDNDVESINPEEMLERLTDRFREVRKSVEKLYEHCGQTQGGPFGGYELKDFSWTGSNESALSIIGKLVEDMSQKVTSAQARAEEIKENWEKEEKQRRLYESYLEDIAIIVGGEGQELPGKDQTLDLVTLRLSELKRQVGAAGERIKELSDSVVRKDCTIRDLEMTIDNASQHEIELNKKLEAMVDEGIKKKQELLEKIEQQAVSHRVAVRELERERDKAIADVQKQLEDMEEAKSNVEHFASQAHEKHTLIVKNLRDNAAASQIEIEETNRKLEEMEISHQRNVERLEGRLTRDMAAVSSKLRETEERKNSDILVLETKLALSLDEIKRQQLSLKNAITERDNATRQLGAEILSGQDAIAGLEKRIQAIQQDAGVQREGDQNVIASLKTELQTVNDATEGERKTLQERIRSQAEDMNELEEMHAEEIKELSNETTKYWTRFGDVKNKYARQNCLRQAEGLRKRSKRMREEQDEEEASFITRMPPTPASSVIAGPSAVEVVRKRESKRRRYDSGIGVDDEEEFERVLEVGV